MRKTYPDFVDKAYNHVGSASNFGHVARDRWTPLRLMAIESYQMFLKNLKKHLGNVYMFIPLIYILCFNFYHIMMKNMS